MNFFDKIPTLHRVGRFLWKWTKWVVPKVFFSLAFLATLIALFVAWENYRTGKAWKDYVAAAHARGEKVSLDDYHEAPVPDDQNFAMTPLLKPLLTDKDMKYATKLRETLDINRSIVPAWRPAGKYEQLQSNFDGWEVGEKADLAIWREAFQMPVLDALKKYDADLVEISTASLRPYFLSFTISELGFNSEKFDIVMQYRMDIAALGNLYVLRGLAELDAGQNNPALDDAMTALRLAHLLSDGTMGNNIYATLLVEKTMQLVWEGLLAHAWPAPQMVALQKELQSFDLPAQLEIGQETSQVRDIDVLEWMSQLNAAGIRSAFGLRGHDWQTESMLYSPQFVFNEAMLESSQFYDKYVKPTYNPAQKRFDQNLIAAADHEADRLTQQQGLFKPQNFLLLPVLRPYAIYAAHAQTSINEAALACALECYRLDQDAYPEQLDILVPQYLAQLPHDLVTGEPLHYQREVDGSYLLYSTGWTGKDNHGELLNPKRGFDRDKDNWIWRFPVK